MRQISELSDEELAEAILQMIAFVPSNVTEAEHDGHLAQLQAEKVRRGTR